MVYENKETESDLKPRDEGKENYDHSQQIKLNNLTVSLWDKKLRKTSQVYHMWDNHLWGRP